MRIELKQISFGDISLGYIDDGEGGVKAYGGHLEVRPSYQREFVYTDRRREAVVRSVMAGLPLNVMYWQRRPDGSLAVMDGQQRTISVCQYINGDYSIDERYFHNLAGDEKRRILDYECLVYVCEGTESEILAWFKTINISTEPLTEQELRNSAYTGAWLYDAKRYFSRTGCPARGLAGEYLNGTPIRQDYLATALGWICDAQGLASVEEYMAVHQHDGDASELWLYFGNVIHWVKTLFPHYRKEMKGVGWGMLYNRYHETHHDPHELERRVTELMEDEEVTSKRGVYEYLLSGDERHLSLRKFSDKDKRTAYERQRGVCPMCGGHFELGEMEGDHVVSWAEGGRTVLGNLKMLCRSCNLRKSSVSLADEGSRP